MARYWVGDPGERGSSAADRTTARPGQQPRAQERERLSDAVRRTLAGNVRADDAE
ncbi:hypothetical protein [Pseudonocardia endophytica]|uniref:Uncharacterized protein n=1 Tax=Pseudonocardia endophytica TaxID=401976 RepID=A0A4R1HTR0_PSEEN|nr:hypothetical protein [Pseudonocardia endophytica]TCK25618.1 hypothetical protein EV378_1432 [Pseudonocardia endophytica]